MVFKENFIACVKANGRILREKDNTVYLPFGSEYSILLKNQNSKNALVRISIDGESIGNDLVMKPNTESEIERDIRDNDFGNKFKFIQKTEKIINHRGDKIDDGLIRIEYWFEKDKDPYLNCMEPLISCFTCLHKRRCKPYIFGPDYPPHFYTTLGSSVGYNSSFSSRNVLSSSAENYTNNNINVDEGITVKGNESYQKFKPASIGELEPNSNVIVISLRGYDDKGNKQVNQPVTTKDKLECPTCGTKSKSNSKFCSECGTYLW